MRYSIRCGARTLAVALAVSLAGAANAQLPQHRTGDGVTWMSGGVSLEERDALRGVADEYNLQIVVAMRGSGEYRATVPVTVEDRNGNPVLSVVTDGPWLLASVPSGRYRVRTGDGQERTVEVGTAGRAVLYFHSPTE